MEKTYTIKPGQKPTDKMLEEVNKAASEKIVFDEDCPELSPAMQKAFEASVKNRRRQNVVA